MTDRVFIEGLTLTTTVGVYEWEKTIKQKLILDIEMAFNNQPAGLSDDVSLCLDYFEVSKAVTEFVTSTQFGLIERVAEEVAQLIMQKFSVSRIKIKVSKPSAIADAKNVAVMIERAMSAATI